MYVEYVVPVISFASPVWFANKTESKEKERIQRKATIWIMGNRIKSYKQRLTELRLLSLSFYFELHDLFASINLEKQQQHQLPKKLNAKPSNNISLTRQKDLHRPEELDQERLTKIWEKNLSIFEYNSKKRKNRPRKN